jgi:histidinol phosphatase-like enzyme
MIMSSIGISEIKDCVFIVKDGVLVDDSLTNVSSPKDVIVYGSAKPCVSLLSEFFQVVVINYSSRYHQRQDNMEEAFQKKLGLYVPAFYTSKKEAYSDLFNEIRASMMPDFERSFLIGSSYEDAVMGRKIGFRETFIVRTGIRSRDPDEKNRLLALDPMPICVDSLWDATRCIKLAVSY